MKVEANCPETFEAPGAVDWERDGEGRHEEDFDKAGGRIEQRSIDNVQPLDGIADYPHVRRIAQAVRLREVLKKKTSSPEIVYVITSLSP